MDRRALRPLAVVAAVACGPRPAPLASGERPTAPPVSVATRSRVSRGAIGYRAAFVGPRLLLSVELGLRFELVIRRLDPGVARPVELHRVDLGPPDWDITGLATAGGPRVWLSSMDGSVREIDVERGAVVRTWRVGHAVTAIAAGPRFVAYGTDRGAICLRRRRDGALLQCMLAHRRRVSALAIAGAELISGSWGGAVHRYRLPSLRRTAAFEIDGAINDLAVAGERVAAAVSSKPPTGDRRRADLGGDIAIVGGGRALRCRGHRGPVTAVRWSTDRTLVSGSWDDSVRGWHAGDARCSERWRRDLGGHNITGLAPSPNGRYLAVSLWVTALDQIGVLLLDYLYPPTR